MSGPRIRTDLVDVYIFRPAKGEACELLQLRRATEPFRGAWHPVMGHIEQGETAVQAAVRELAEEVGLTLEHAAFRGMWSLEQIHPYFLPEQNEIMLSPRLAVQVGSEFEPTLNHEHDAARWAAADARAFVWPGQRAAIAEILARLWPEQNPLRRHTRIF